jgi:hypothetical protein
MALNCLAGVSVLSRQLQRWFIIAKSNFTSHLWRYQQHGCKSARPTVGSAIQLLAVWSAALPGFPSIFATTRE